MSRLQPECTGHVPSLHPSFSLADDDLGEASLGERSVTGALRALIRDRLVPALRRPAVKSGVLVTFTVFFILSLAALPRLERCVTGGVAGKFCCDLQRPARGMLDARQGQF